MQEHPTDMCPVCLVSRARVGSPYCSIVCREKARTFRRRFDRMLSALSAVFIRHEWDSGVVLTLTLPLMLSHRFPDAASKLTIPSAVYYGLDKYGTREFYNDLERWLGTELAVWLRVGMERGIISSSSRIEGGAMKWFMGKADLIFSDPDHTFTCKACHKTYYHSRESYDQTEDCCNDCLIAAIPF